MLYSSKPWWRRLFFRLSDLELEIIVIDIFKHLRMRQCRGIPQAFEVVAGGNLAQDAAHRLAGKCFRQFGDKLDLFRLARAPIWLRTRCAVPCAGFLTTPLPFSPRRRHRSSPLISWGMGTTAASPTAGWAMSTDSISEVLRR